MKKIFEGIGVAIVTPFINGKIDYTSLERLINKCINDGADAIIALGTTGEGSTISASERKKIISFCVDKIHGKAKLIIGTGNNDFKTCLKNTLQAKTLGADGALVVTPYYNKTTQEGLIKYYDLLSRLQFPIIMYNVPSRTGLNIEPDTVNKIISTNPYIFGLKESTTDINRIMKLHSICRDKIAIYSGEDSLNHIFYVLGSSGCISVTANLLTKKLKDIYKYAKQNNIPAMLASQEEIQHINESLFVETNPIPVKTLLKAQGLISSSELRLPLVDISNKNRGLIQDLTKDISNIL